MQFKMREVGGGLLIVVALILVQSCWGTVYTVGGSSGWTIGVDYSTWASSNTFLVGDTLVFNYASGHTVDQVSQSDYTACAVGNAITTDSSGATTFPLKSAGPLYFICGGVGHCGSGMKLALTVSGAGSGTSSSAPAVATPSTANSTTAATGAVPCTTMPNVYGTAGSATPYLVSESPTSLSSLPAALLAVAGGVLVFKMMA